MVGISDLASCYLVQEFVTCVGIVLSNLMLLPMLWPRPQCLFGDRVALRV